MNCPRCKNELKFWGKTISSLSRFYCKTCKEVFFEEELIKGDKKEVGNNILNEVMI